MPGTTCTEAAAPRPTRPRPSLHGRRARRGQVLVIVVAVLLILLVVAIFLVDLQSTVRLRQRAQTAADAAALTGAAWQGRTLNAIGDLNLIKAATVLLTDFAPAAGVAAADPREQLLQSTALLTQMQTRLTYVGPLLGFAAAQQAAKHNGMRSVPLFDRLLAAHIDNYLDPAGGDLYRSLYGDDPAGLGYAWIDPYRDMLRAVLSDGVAANPVNARFLGGLPQLDGPDADLLLDQGFYRAVYAWNFCWFYRRGIGVDHGAIDLNAIQYSRNPEGYFPGSEFLPLYVTFAAGPPPDDALAPSLAERGLQPHPADQPGLNEITWAVYDGTGDGYGWDRTEDYQFINDYLRSDVRSEYTYAGAAARMVTMAQPPVLTGRWAWKYGRPEAEEENRSLGEELSWSTQEFEPGKSFATQGRRLAAAEERMARLRQSNTVTSVAAAKPFGALAGSPPQAAGIVLPVFTDVRLIPVGLVRSNPLSAEPDFYQFIVEYFGHPAYPNVPDDVRNRYAYYLNAIDMYNDPNSAFNQAWRDFDLWRTSFMAGPDGESGTADDRRDPCLPAFGPGPGGGGGSRGGPDIIH